jgi:hypothetical protein
MALKILLRSSRQTVNIGGVDSSGQPTDTIRGPTWTDLGLGEDSFEVGHVTGEALWKRLALIHSSQTAGATLIANL